MPDADEKGVTLEVLGTCMTNTTPGSKHDAKVEYRHLWSYAQQAALIAVSEKSAKDGCYHLITDPERRAKRIAAHYADLYFKSLEMTNEKLCLYWPALAAFVVKDVVEAFRYAREDVLHRDWKDAASIFRNSTVSDLGSVAMTSDSPYKHAIRTYSALAKGNLWLFMDIYPWLWFFLEFGVNKDGSLNKQRLDACLPERDWETYQSASKRAVEELPFGPKWMDRLTARLSEDRVYKKAGQFFKTSPSWSPGGGYGAHAAAGQSAHQYCRNNAKEHDHGYRTPPGKYWFRFQEAYYVMDSEHSELRAIANDTAATAALLRLRKFNLTNEITEAYSFLISQHAHKAQSTKNEYRFMELNAIAQHEQVNVLQPLIYNDSRLKVTMDLSHKFSRLTAGWISPLFTVVYSFNPTTTDPTLKTVFDAPAGIRERFAGNRKSLPNESDRMEFVAAIAKDFHKLMCMRLPYMISELQKIRGWVNA